ncbi:MAG: Serine protease [Bacteroidetes bacterium]|nr:Serine protease [Bacteroidota bacterium]
MNKYVLIFSFLIITKVYATDGDTCRLYASEIEISSQKLEIPYNLICHVKTFRKNKFWFGGKEDYSTFTFISPRILIGAYHALAENASTIQSIEVDIYAHEENGKLVILRTLHFSKKEFSIIKPFHNSGIENDCGLIVLNKSVSGLPTSFPKLVTLNSAKSKSSSFRISGYPYDKDISFFNGQKLWERRLSFQNTVALDSIVYYPCTRTSVGDSGGPLWFINGDQLFLFGTHVGGNKDNFNNLWGECFNENKIRILNEILENNK